MKNNRTASYGFFIIGGYFCRFSQRSLLKFFVFPHPVILWGYSSTGFKLSSPIKTERDGLDEYETFSSGIEDLKGEEGIIIAVKAPENEIDRLRSYIEQSGAVHRKVMSFLLYCGIYF